jgi:hypothetical protein
MVGLIMSLKVNEKYSKQTFEKEISNPILGISKDILKEKYAPNIDYADFHMFESKNKNFVYCIKYISSDKIIDKLLNNKQIKVLAIISREQFNLI